MSSFGKNTKPTVWRISPNTVQRNSRVYFREWSAFNPNNVLSFQKFWKTFGSESEFSILIVFYIHLRFQTHSSIKQKRLSLSQDRRSDKKIDPFIQKKVTKNNKPSKVTFDKKYYSRSKRSFHTVKVFVETLHFMCTCSLSNKYDICSITSAIYQPCLYSREK